MLTLCYDNDIDAGEIMEPPSYNVAVSLPTYDESLRSKQQDEEQQQQQQQLCESTALPEVMLHVDMIMVMLLWKEKALVK